jgi:glycosyltransferase involved in cell wall biosynthesis
VTLRILYVTDSLMAGGIESHLVELVTRLDRARFEPHVLCLYGARTRGLHFAPLIQAAGIPLEVLDIGWGARDKALALARIVAATHRLRPDIVQAEGYHANLLTRLARPLIPPTRLIGTLRGGESRKQLLYERLSYRLCACLVACAPFLKQTLVGAARVPEARVRVIPHAVDVARFTATHDPSLRQRLAPHGERVLLSVGRISRQKSMHLLAEACGLLKRENRLNTDVRVCIVGQIEDPAMQARLKAAIQRDDLGPWITQHTETLRPEDYYHASDATVLFTTLEGIPMVVLESLAAGRPVVISDEANAAGMIEDGVTGWVARTGDVAHLAEILARVLALPDTELAAMRPACLRRAEEYSMERMVARYAALYAALSARLAPPAAV